MNDARIIRADYEVGNGVVHEIDKVLFPPEGRLLDKLTTNPELR